MKISKVCLQIKINKVTFLECSFVQMKQKMIKGISLVV